MSAAERSSKTTARGFMGRDEIEKSMTRSMVLTLLAVAVVVRVFYLLLLHALPEWSLLSIDNHYYHNWAQLLAREGWLGEGAYFRPPLYAFLLSLVYLVGGPSLFGAHVLGLLISVTSVLLTAAITTRLFGRQTGLLAGTIHALLPLSLYFDHELLSDGLMLLFILGGCYCWLRWRSEHDLRWFALLTGSVLLATLARSVAGLLFIGIIWEYAVILRTQRGRALMAAIAAGILPVLLILTPLVARNLTVGADPLTTATQGGINFYLGNHDGADGVSAVMPEPYGFNWQLRDVALLATYGTGKGLTPEQVSGYWYDQGWHWIATEPVQAAGLIVRKLRWLCSATEVPNNRSDEPYLSDHPLLRFNPIRFGLLFPLACFGLAAVLPRPGPARALAFVSACLAVALLLFLVASRFRYPWVVTLIPFASLGVVIISDLIRGRSSIREFRLPIVAVVIGLVLALLPSPTLGPIPGAPPHATQGLALLAQQRPKEALEVFRADLGQPAPEAYLNCGIAWLALGNSDSARYCFDRERAAFPERPKAWTNLAGLYLRSGQTDSALACARAAVQRRGYDPEANLALLGALTASHQPDSLVRAAQEAVGATRQLKTAVDASALLIRSNRVKEAAQILQAALQFGEIPYEQNDLMWTDQIMAERANRPVFRAKALQNLSTACLYLHLPNDAVSAAREARRLTPDSLEAKGALLLALHEAGLTIERDALRTSLSKSEQASEQMQGLLGYIDSSRTVNAK